MAKEGDAMTIDEQVASFMALWVNGVNNADRGTSVDVGSAYPAQCAGRAAYLAAEQQERERLEKAATNCPKCEGSGKNWKWSEYVLCPVCHGTGRREP
jgi:DnaJ-class molecular chaperone